MAVAEFMLEVVATGATAAPRSAEDAATREAVRQGFALLSILAVVGVLLVMSVALLFVLAKNRRAGREVDRRLNKPSGRASAWHAAGARAEPLHPDPDLPSDDDLRSPGDDPDDWDAEDLR